MVLSIGWFLIFEVIKDDISMLNNGSEYYLLLE
jgi:hypothetical protein